MNAIKILVGGLLLLPMLTACGGGVGSATQASYTDDEQLDLGASNQAPKVECQMYEGANAILARQISSNPSEDIFVSNFTVGENVRFDCRSTEDEDATANLRFYINETYDTSPNNFRQVSSQFSLPTSVVGRRQMAMRVVDTKGIRSTKEFTLVVECANGQRPQLDLRGVSVVPGSNGRLNYFNYAVNTAFLTHGEGALYSWDFNGDQAFDVISMTTPNIKWTSQASLPNIYTIFSTRNSETRKVGLKIRNNCELESYYEVPVQFAMDAQHGVPRVPLVEGNASTYAVAKPYYYLQEDVRRASDLQNPRHNGDVLVTKYAGDTYNRVACDYKKKRTNEPAGFSINAQNWYQNNDIYKHGQYVKVESITDNLSVGTQTITNANLTEARYSTAASDDIFAQEVFSKNSTCQIRLRVVRAQAVTPCATTENADFTEAGTITILGEYSCPSLRQASTGNTVEIENGKFFCEVGPVDQCVGGGGGGGGAPPWQE